MPRLKLLQSQQIEQVVCVPGNGTASMERQNLPLNVDDFEGIGQFARSHDISLVVVGPELPLALGITPPAPRYYGIRPHERGAAIEASKSWAKL